MDALRAAPRHWAARGRAFRGNSRLRAAFTLIELLVVIVILGILLAVAVPTFLRQQTKAQDSRTQQYLTTAFETIRAGLPDTNNQYPASTSMVSWIQQSEPELTAQRGDCLTGVTSAPVDAVLVDPSSTANSLQLCARSQSGNVWKLTASNTGVQQLLDGTLVALTVSGNEITDATRAAGVQGDGLSSDSSTGVWEGTTNLLSNGGFESNTTGWTGSSGAARTNAWAKFGSNSYLIDYTPNSNDASAFSPAATCSAGSTYSASAWVNVLDNVTAGVTILIGWYDASMTQLSYSSAGTVFTGTGVTRLSKTATAPANTAYCTIRVVMGNNVGLQRMRYYVDGAQIEQKPLTTPYVETNGSTSTRNAARVQAPMSLINSTQSWIALRLRLGFASTAPRTSPNFAFAADQTSNEKMVLWLDTDNKWKLKRVHLGSGAINASSAQSWAAGDTVTVIAAWDSAGLHVSINGGAFQDLADSYIPSLTIPSFDIGSDAGGNQLDGSVLWAATGNGTLSSADASTINSWGNSDPARSSFPSAAQATMVWNGVGATGSLK